MNLTPKPWVNYILKNIASLCMLEILSPKMRGPQKLINFYTSMHKPGWHNAWSDSVDIDFFHQWSNHCAVMWPFKEVTGVY